VSGNDEKVLWDDAGQPVQLPPGKDTISFIDIGNRENPKILTRIALENSIFGPPTARYEEGLRKAGLPE